MGINHEIFDQFNAHVPGGLKAKSGHAMWKTKIVVDGLGDVHDLESPLG